MTQIIDHPERGRFELPVEGGDVAIAAYELGPGTMAITHVVVPAHADGKGVGGKLAAHAIEVARQRGLKVIPACPFVASWFKRNPELAALLA
jgi:predicted GNAT family acetyltransferase